MANNKPGSNVRFSIIAFALALVFIFGVGFILLYALNPPIGRGSDGHLVCYSDQGEVLFSENVTGAWLDDRMWHFDGGGISATRFCVFSDNAE